MQLQKINLKEIQKEQLNAFYDPKLDEIDYKRWYMYKLSMRRIGMMSQELNAYCNKQELFSNTLRASTNYAEVYQGHKDYLNPFLKPAFLVLYMQEDKKLYAILVTQQEADEIAPRLVNHSWIATTLDTVVAGKPPDDILLNKDYQLLREQIRFFNGELRVLVNQDTALIWLQVDPLKKIAFFENKLQNITWEPRGTTRIESSPKPEMRKVFFTLVNIPMMIFLSLIGRSYFLKPFLPRQTEYQKLAEVFAYINQNYFEQSPTLDQIQQQFNLPLSSFTYIDAHLKWFKSIISLILSIQCGVQIFSAEEKDCFLECTGISIDNFYANQGINLENCRSSFKQ